MISKIQGPDVNSVTPQSHEVSDGSRNNYMQSPSQLLTPPVLPTHSSNLCYHKQARWGRQKWLCPRAHATLDTPLIVGGPIWIK